MTVSRATSGRFDTFVEGPATRLALAAGRAVAESRHPPYNPLLIQGGPGLGKTHLLEAVAARAVEVDPARRVALVQATDRGSWEADADADLLLVDDLQEAGDGDDARALADLLERRSDEGRATVLAVAGPPGEDRGLDSRLTRLAASGLVTELGFPSLDQRRTILMRVAAEAEPAVREEVLEALAAMPVGSVRELVGALRRLMAFQSVSQAPLDESQAMVLLTGVLVPPPEPMPDEEGIAQAAPRSASRHPAASPASPAEAPDEFGDFLSDVAATVAHQVDRWRNRVADAILRWEAEGVRTARLEALLRQEIPGEPDAALLRFEEDVVRLRALAAEVAALVPARAGDPVLRDPDAVAAAEALLEEVRIGERGTPAANAEFGLDRFAEGAANRAALQAARAVIAEPGLRYNPLFLVGASGTGKTHLVHGIALALSREGHRFVACLDAARFLADVAAGVTAGYRHAGAFLLDGLEGALADARAQDTLIALVDALRASGRQLVMSAASVPAELDGLDARLRTRLEGGLTVELGPPDREVRRHLVRRLLAGSVAAEDAALIDYLANRPAESVRAVEGLVHRLLSAAEAQRGTPSHALAREVLEAFAPRGAGRVRGPRSGIAASLVAGPRAREKMIETWPSIGDRLIEDLR